MKAQTENGAQKMVNHEWLKKTLLFKHVEEKRQQVDSLQESQSQIDYHRARIKWIIQECLKS